MTRTAQPPEPAGARVRREADFFGMVGRSPAMTTLYRRIERFAQTRIPLLVLGETGSGKEMVAQAVRQIAHAEQRFQAVNCAAISKGLIESELFGHEQGAFTGAVRRHQGILSQVDGGVLFLDEIAELPLSAQAKLLRVLESGELRPVGSEQTRRVSFRLLAATNRELEALVRRGRFRLDLLHRLGAARLVIPPLRERREDIPPLAAALLRRFCEANGLPPLELGPEAALLLQRAPWPGNVRELRNVVEAAASVAEGARLEVGQIYEFLGFDPPREDAPPEPPPTLEAAHRSAEREAIVSALGQAAGNRARAARILGISVATLYRRLSSHRITA